MRYVCQYNRGALLLSSDVGGALESQIRVDCGEASDLPHDLHKCHHIRVFVVGVADVACGLPASGGVVPDLLRKVCGYWFYYFI